MQNRVLYKKREIIDLKMKLAQAVMNGYKLENLNLMGCLTSLAVIRKLNGQIQRVAMTDAIIFNKKGKIDKRRYRRYVTKHIKPRIYTAPNGCKLYDYTRPCRKQSTESSPCL